MANLTVNEETINALIDGLSSFVWTDGDAQEREDLRQHFRTTYDREKIKNLTMDYYFCWVEEESKGVWRTTLNGVQEYLEVLRVDRIINTVMKPIFRR